MEFVGRKNELEKLNKMISTPGMGTCVILGRRRIGKSELIKQALKECDCTYIYYECKRVSERNNVESLSSIVSETFNLPKFGFPNINSLLEYVFNYAKNEKIVLVLDEFPYLRENVYGLDSIIQSLIDQYRETSNIKLVLLGSFVDIMKSLFEHENPLFGRIDLTIDLKQLDYYEASKFYKDYSYEDKVRLYSVFGGIPYYNRLIDQSKSVKENIINLIASDGARLENEIELYLNSEISKLPNANQTFEALSMGYSNYSDIFSHSHVSSGPTLIDTLEKLMKMEIVSKEFPINQENNKRRVHYLICDNLSLFFYKFIYRNSSKLKVMNANDFYDKYINEEFETKYVPKCFENICKQYLIKENKKGNIKPPFYKIGKYYYDDPISKQNGEFDIVTEDEKGYIFYEVKFVNKQLTNAVVDDEIKQVKETGLNCYRYGFITKSGFKEKNREDVTYLTLKDIYSDEK